MCVYMYAMVFSWYLICVFVGSVVLDVGVVIYVVCLHDERCVVWVLLGAVSRDCAGDG